MVNCRGTSGLDDDSVRADTDLVAGAQSVPVAGSLLVIRTIQREPNRLLRGSFPLLMVFLFCTFSAILEVIPFVGRLRLLLLVGVLSLAVVFAADQGIRVLKSSTGKALAAFTAWFIICIPFSIWRGGSLSVFLEFWYKSALVFLMIAGMLTTLPQAKKLFHAIAYAIGLAAIMTVVRNSRWDNRLVLLDTRYANPNDLAWTLLVGLTFIAYLYMRGNRTQKAIAVVAGLADLLALSRTGSRAGFIGAATLGVITFVQASKATRIKLAASVPVALVLILLVVPAELRFRYTTFLAPENYDPSQEFHTAESNALGSAEARLQLAKDGLKVTATHPLFGVGPGNFPVAQNDLALERGQKPIWHVTHNTYLQLSSETGIPGFLIYLVFVYQTFKMLNSILRTKSRSKEWRDLRTLALTLRSAFALFVVSAFFINLAYNVDIPILSALATALWFMAKKQRAIDKAASQQELSAESQLEPALEPIAVGQY